MNVLLLDGSGLAYRSYYAFARNPLRTSGGEETGLTFAFMNTLLRLIERYAPEAAAVVFDAPGPTFRHQLLPEYKAGRPAMPDSMRRQLGRLHEALEALNLQRIEHPGVEADDLLGTLARRYEEAGEHVFIVTGDKDFQQLVSERVRLVRFNRAGGEMHEYGADELDAELGIRPSQMVDFLALCGDSIDNVPGIPGVGEKTAAQLVQQFGSLDALFAAVASIPRPALRRRIAAGEAVARRARELVCIRTDVELPLALEALAWTPPDWARVRALLRELEFFQLLRMVPRSAATAPPLPEVVRVEHPEALAALGKRLGRASRLALQLVTEDASHKRGRILALGLATDPGRVDVVAVERQAVPAGGQLTFELGEPSLGLATILQAVAPAFANERIEKVGHDIKRDILLLEDAGVGVKGTLYDTLLASYVLQPGRRTHLLPALALEHLDLRLQDERELFDHNARDRDLAALPVERLLSWTAQQTHVIWRLAERLSQRLAADQLTPLFQDVEMPLVGVLVDMERHGVRVDVAALQELSHELGNRAAALERRIHELAGHAFNINSPKQLGDVLFGEMHLPHGKRSRTGWSTDVGVLEDLAEEHELPRCVLEYRTLVKLQSTYAEALPRLVRPTTGRIHTSFNQAVASTGRLSSSEPNLQNIPVRSDLGRRIREAFVPAEGSVLLAADYSQIELRIMAHLSQDRGLMQVFRQGGDVHASTAARIAGCRVEEVTPEQRGAAKTVNFGVLYGMGGRGLARQLRIPLEEARRFIEEYFATYPGVRAYTRDMVERARSQGHVATILGRRLLLPDLHSSNPAQRAAAERVAVNAPIQGSAADLIKLAMVRVKHQLDLERSSAVLILQVHDELLLECPFSEVEEVTALVRQEMEGVVVLSVPIVVDVGIGRNWAEAH